MLRVLHNSASFIPEIVAFVFEDNTKSMETLKILSLENFLSYGTYIV